MRILELLLPPDIKDKSLPKHSARHIDALQTRMNSYVDKICDPSTSAKGREFLKAKLKDDYDEFRGALKEISENSEEINEIFSKDKNWEWEYEDRYEAAASFTVGEIPYKFYVYSEGNRIWGIEFRTDSNRAPGLVKSRFGLTGTGNSVEVMSIIVDIMKSFVDRYNSDIDKLEFSAEEPSRKRLYLHIVKRLLPEWKVIDHGDEFEVVKPNRRITEAVLKVPLTNDDFKAVKELMSHPMPAIVAPIYLQDLIEDDEFTTLLKEIEEKTPNRDVRPFVAEWIKRVMPDQLSRFRDDAQTYKQKLGNMSPIHGYDPHEYRGSTEPVTGDAFGRR